MAGDHLNDNPLNKQTIVQVTCKDTTDKAVDLLDEIQIFKSKINPFVLELKNVTATNVAFENNAAVVYRIVGRSNEIKIITKDIFKYAI